MLRTIRNILISVVVMLALIVGGGIAYVKFAGGEDGAKKEPAPAQNTNTDNFALPKPKTPNPKAPEGAAIESFLTPAKAGTNTSITIKTPHALFQSPIMMCQARIRASLQRLQVVMGSPVGHGR
jgi:hypothetical protein